MSNNPNRETKTLNNKMNIDGIIQNDFDAGNEQGVSAGAITVLARHNRDQIPNHLSQWAGIRCSSIKFGIPAPNTKPIRKKGKDWLVPPCTCRTKKPSCYEVMFFHRGRDEGEVALMCRKQIERCFPGALEEFETRSEFDDLKFLSHPDRLFHLATHDLEKFSASRPNDYDFEVVASYRFGCQKIVRFHVDAVKDVTADGEENHKAFVNRLWNLFDNQFELYKLSCCFYCRPIYFPDGLPKWYNECNGKFYGPIE